MKFISTRNPKNCVSFKQAVLNCIPEDGGLYVPECTEDLRHWIYYTNKNTSFQNIAGTLTSAWINEEFSPIICETIATRAYSFEPVLKRLDDQLYVLELFHGPTGSHKDFSVSFLTSCLETILQMENTKSILLDATTGELGACMSKAMKDKKLLKSVILCPKGKFRGLDESDFVWNGGNIYPVEIDGTELDCQNLVRKIFENPELVKKYHLTVANTANIGRLLPQEFFYTYAFSRIKDELDDAIYYALSPENYGNLVSGLYSWQLSLPVNGFIVPANANLQLDVQGNCQIVDSFVPFSKRPPCNPASPSNLERLEYLFQDSAPMLKNFIYPSKVSIPQREAACKMIFKKYNYFAGINVSESYAASLQQQELWDEGGAIVLVDRHAPGFSAGFLKHCLGEAPELPESVKAAFNPVTVGRKPLAPNDIDSLITILNSVNLLRMFNSAFSIDCIF